MVGGTMKTKDVKYSNNSCDDNVFGQIKQDESKQWAWISIQAKRYKKLKVPNNILKIEDGDKKNPVVLLILESPHREEYDNNGKPICPANGTSGKNIYSHLCDIFNNRGNVGKKQFINNSNYLKKFLDNHETNIIDIWIVNSIQKQCSLGIKPINNIIKESNWIDEWCSSNNNLITRCEKIIGDMTQQQDYFIINLCTKGEYIPMKELVEKEFLNIPGVKPLYCKGPHPSSWSRIRQIEFN